MNETRITNTRLTKDKKLKGCVSIAILGHVDSGKSTTCGQLLLNAGKISNQTIAANQKIGESVNKTAFRFAYVMDTAPEERESGITINVNTKEFETDSKIVTIIDCPGHENYGKNAIHGMSQADLGMIVISAPDFSVPGMDLDDINAKACNSVKHLTQLKNHCVQKVIVGVNKMDDKEVSYSETVYNTIVENYTKVLKFCKLNNTANSIPYVFVPYCGLTQVEGTSENISEPSTKMPWYTGKTLVDTIDSMQLKEFDAEAPAVAKMTKLTHPKGVGTIITATVLSGEFRPGMKIIIKPAFVETEIKTIQSNNNFVEVARVNDAIGIAIKGNIKKDELDTDSLISEIPRAPKMVREITARVRVEYRLEKQIDRDKRQKTGDAGRRVNMLSYLQKIQLYISTTRVSAEVTEILGIYRVNPDTGRVELRPKSEVPVSEGKRQKLHVPQMATALIRLTLERPVVVSKEGPDCITKLSKIIINDGRDTIALGTITDYELAQNETS